MSDPLPQPAADDRAAAVLAGGPETAGGRVLRRLLRQPVTLLVLGYLVALCVVAVFAPVLAPHGEAEQNLEQVLVGPGGDYPLGTDDLGRDTLSRLLYGSRVTLQAAFQAVIVAALIGVPLGLLVGYRGGWWDRTVMRVVDVGDALPGIVLAFAVIAVLGRGLTNAMIAVGMIFVTSYVRLTRALVLGERERLYVDAARVSGLRTGNVLLKQVLPNIAGPLVVQSTIYMGNAVLIEAALSFLGLGLDITRASWGGMLSAATQLQSRQPLLPWPPGLAITITVLAFNLLGDGLRDALGGERALTSRNARRKLAALRRTLRKPTPATPPTPTPAASAATPSAALEIDDLHVRFPQPAGDAVTVVDGVSLTLRPAETLGLVGESGSGKTMTGLAVMGLLPPPGVVAAGSIRLDGRELTALPERAYRDVRGNDIAMVFQDPLVALSPVHTVGRQLTQALRNHRTLTAAQARARAAELLAVVGVPDPARRLGDYPHQFSGGMAQRVVIAMALAGEPKVLIADEPTTALDVTIQRQVLDLLVDLQERFGMAVLLITHDLGVVADACDRAAVMYAGQIVEEAGVDELFTRPRHPYTSALLAAMPRGQALAGRLPAIPGSVPPPQVWPRGCRFHPRCEHARDRCTAGPVPLTGGARCVRQDELVLHPPARDEARS